ncbi:MAG: C-terminal binding protein [Verrucomicrobiota bacterium]
MPDRPKVVITDFITEPLDPERAILDGTADIIALDARSPSDLNGHIDDADALMIYHYLRLDRPHIDRLSHCKIIVRPGVGYDLIDIEAARENKIPVCNVPDYGTEEVADSALAMTLSLARAVHFHNSRLRRATNSADWSPEPAAPIHRLRNRNLGIVGCGRIGTATALRAKAFGCNVTIFDPHIPHGVEKALGVRRVHQLSDLLTQSHILSLHCPLTDETENLIGDTELAALPKGAIIINTARGAVLDTEAVVKHLASGHLAGAGIDVLNEEPPPEDSPTLKAWRDPSHPAHDRLLLNPHAAYYSEEGTHEFRTKAAQEVLRALTNQPLHNQVN